MRAAIGATGMASVVSVGVRLRPIMLPSNPVTSRSAPMTMPRCAAAWYSAAARASLPVTTAEGAWAASTRAVAAIA
jgi:hypothetical protein